MQAKKKKHKVFELDMFVLYKHIFTYKYTHTHTHALAFINVYLYVFEYIGRLTL